MLNLQKYLYFKENDINNGVRTGHNNNASIKEGKFGKLYKDELIKRTERQKALAQIYSPTFSPKVFKFHNNTNANTNNKNNTENANEENNQNNKNKKDIRICNNVYQINNMVNKGNNNNIIIGEYNNKNNISENYHNYYINNDFEKQIKSRFFDKLSNTKGNRSIDLNEEIKKEINKGKNKGKYNNGNIKYSNNNNEKNIKDNISNNYQKLDNNINSKNKNYEIRVHLNDRKEYLSNGKDKKRYRNKSVGY